MTLPRVLVIGAGLIGTSVALALRERGGEVWLSDHDPATARLAADMGAGAAVPDLRDAKGIADVAVLAVPPAFVAAGLAHAQECAVADVYTDVASVKSLPVRQARDAGCDLEAFVPGHPLAGRERHGPAAARADLFLGRTWALCPLPENAPAAVDAVTGLVAACGADVVRVDPATHDQWVALVSHAPHLVSVAMAARLAGQSAPAGALRLAGQGLRDVTRIAAGDPELWAQILAANAAPVAQVLQAVADDLAAAARALGAARRAVRRGPAGPGPGRRRAHSRQARREAARAHRGAGRHRRPARRAGPAVRRGRRGHRQHRRHPDRALTRPAGRRRGAVGPAR